MPSSRSVGGESRHPPGAARHRVGLLADSHARDAITRAAVRLLRLRGVDVLIHLGDLGSFEVLEALVDPGDDAAEDAAEDAGDDAAGSRPPPIVHVVFGNVDHDADRLARRAAMLGMSVHKVSAHGVSAHGVSAHGVSAHGVSAHGVSAHGVSAHGVSAHGVSTCGGEGYGASAYGGAGRIEISGKTLAIAHGHVYRDLERALEDGVDYFCHGHTHVPRDDRVGRTRVLNPGALHRTLKPTVGWLDVLEDRFELIEVPRPERG